jgi:hypothetical protein
MSGSCPVVRIKHEASTIYGGFLEINESDFDPKIHELFSDESAEDEAPKAKPKGKGKSQEK